MKKLIVISLLILILGGTVFYFGWIQIRLPEHTYGILFSKTGGWERTVLRPGVFLWRWEPLLPTNATLYTFRLLPQTVTLSGGGTLPSADVYSSVFDKNPDFSYRFEFEASYLIVPDALPDLVIEKDVTPDSLPQWYDTATAGMQSLASEIIAEIFTEDGSASAESGAPHALVAERLEERIAERFPSITLIDLIPREIMFPDPELYRTGRRLYLSAVEARREALADAAVQSVRLKTTTEDRIDRLREYGELFSEYPVLLQYLAIEQGSRPEDLSLQMIPDAPEPTVRQESGGGQE